MSSTTEAVKGEYVENALAPAPPRSRAPKRGAVNTIVWFVVLLGLTIIVLYPLVWLFLATFKSAGEFGQNPGMFPQNPTLENYVKVLDGIAGIPLWRFFANSVFLAVMSVVGTIVSSSMAAYAFARVKFKGQKILFAAMIGTLLLPFHVIIIPQYIIFQKLDLIDTYVPLLLGRFLATEAFFIFLIVQFIRNIPQDMDEAARLDGAGHPRIFFSIILPLIRPALVTTAIFTFIGSWNDFLGPLLYVNSPEQYPLPVALRLYNDATSGSDLGATFAVSFLALLPILIFFIVFQRFLIAGVATQGLKG